VGSDRREAFERLWREEYPRVVRTAWLITGDREEAADVAQETFARAYERWRTVSRLDRPGGWLQRVAANLSLTWRRQRARQRRPVERESVVEIELPDPGLFRALRALPPAQRAAVVLRHWSDLSVEDTAQALGKRPGTVKALTHQGLARLRELLAQEEDDEIRH
jgi:RNA polymerase sigma-70 factor (sigma-E family)